MATPFEVHDTIHYDEDEYPEWAWDHEKGAPYEWYEKNSIIPNRLYEVQVATWIDPDKGTATINFFEVDGIKYKPVSDDEHLAGERGTCRFGWHRQDCPDAALIPPAMPDKTLLAEAIHKGMNTIGCMGPFHNCVNRYQHEQAAQIAIEALR